MNNEEDLESIVMKLSNYVNRGNKRLTHKVRTARYYGGIATIDVVGCYLDCAYCWVPDFKKSLDFITKKIAKFNYLSPAETAEILIKLANKNHLESVRLSGGEPTLNKDHLLETIDLTTNEGFNYILETNGLLLDDPYVRDLSKLRNSIYVYFSLKGGTPQKFSELTRRPSRYWYKQLYALEFLIKSKFRLGINIMTDFLSETDILKLIENLAKIDTFAPLAVDLQTTSIFPHVRKRLIERDIKYSKSRINKEKYLKIIKTHYPDIYEQGYSYMTDLGMMNFFDYRQR